MKTRQIWVDVRGNYRLRYGEGFCGYCGQPIPKGRRYWCGENCIELMNDEVQSWAKLRDDFIGEHFECAQCDKPRPVRIYECWEWIVDHIIPIAIGGEEFDEINLQVLCPECNKIKTAMDMKNIALQRRNEKELDHYTADIIEFRKTKKLYEYLEEL